MPDASNSLPMFFCHPHAEAFVSTHKNSQASNVGHQQGCQPRSIRHDPKAQKKKQNEDRFTKMDGSIPRNSEAIFKVNMQKRFLNKIRGETFFQV